MTSSEMTAFDVLRDFEGRARARNLQLPESNRGPTATFHGIGFRIGDTDLVASMTHVREIMPIPEMSRVPGAKPWLRGIANIRGRLFAVTDLREFLLGAPTRVPLSARILLAEHGDTGAGLLVDEVFGIHHFPEQRREPRDERAPPDLSEYLLGRFVIGGRTWYEFDMVELLTGSDFLQAAA